MGTSEHLQSMTTPDYVTEAFESVFSSIQAGLLVERATLGDSAAGVRKQLRCIIDAHPDVLCVIERVFD